MLLMFVLGFVAATALWSVVIMAIERRHYWDGD